MRDIYEITEVESLLAFSVIENRTPYGKFYLIEKDADYQITYVAIDNTTGDAWTEEFDDKEKMLAWLRGDIEL